MNYQRINTILGWSVGLIAGIVYVCTVEPTASFWDAGEFIATSYKLEVPHPPGAPFYLLLGRLFSMLALENVLRVAWAVNMLSVVSSGLTITFLFWTITALGKRWIHTENTYAYIRLFASAAIGSLIFTFSDSFWFSAVEAEVYGLSSLFTAVMVWAMLRWEQCKSKERAWKWLLFISYLVGLSIGVHLLGLVTIPAIALIYYFKVYGHKPYAANTHLRNALGAMIVGLLIVGLVMIGIIQWLPGIAAGFDIFFVNSLRLPFYTGIIVFMILCFGGLIVGVIYTQVKGLPVANMMCLSLCFILLGYSSYTLILIRSNANPPIDENNPENVLTFLSYLKREQYGDRPLVYGHHFKSERASREETEPIYKKGDTRYEIKEWDYQINYKPGEKMVLPRIYSQRHKEEYQAVLGLGEYQRPTFTHNLQFLFGYQIGYMYMRYFMWNFVGRAGDEDGADWLAPWESFEELPAQWAESKGRNNYWGLPLLLGIFGLLFQSKRDIRGFGFVSALFLLMGLGLVLYLNMPPREPRERDYIYTGSYYAFAIWTGFGLLFIEQYLSKFLKNRVFRLITATLLSLLPVGLMAKENWDDHNRSERYFSVDSARNLLESCDKNAILFTGGDNDTFPLWYAQEVEGVRTDVRVVVLSYFNTDWYIEQMTRPAYESAPLPFSVPLQEYVGGGANDILYVEPNENIQGAISLHKYLELVRRGDPRIRIQVGPNKYFNVIPSQNFYINVDTVKVKEYFPLHLRDKIRPYVDLTLADNYIEKKDLAILDLIASQQWHRPIYFNHTSLQGTKLNIRPYVVQEGLAYRFLPIEPNYSVKDRWVNTSKSYENIMQRFSWRSLQNEEIYFSEDYKEFISVYRSMISTVSIALHKEGDTIRAQELFHFALEKMPKKTFPFDVYSLSFIHAGFAIGENEKATRISTEVLDRCKKILDYLETKHPKIYYGRGASGKDLTTYQEQVIAIRRIMLMLQDVKASEEIEKYSAMFGKYMEN